MRNEPIADCGLGLALTKKNIVTTQVIGYRLSVISDQIIGEDKVVITDYRLPITDYRLLDA